MKAPARDCGTSKRRPRRRRRHRLPARARAAALPGSRGPKRRRRRPLPAAGRAGGGAARSSMSQPAVTQETQITPRRRSSTLAGVARLRRRLGDEGEQGPRRRRLALRGVHGQAGQRADGALHQGQARLVTPLLGKAPLAAACAPAKQHRRRRRPLPPPREGEAAAQLRGALRLVLRQRDAHPLSKATPATLIGAQTQPPLLRGNKEFYNKTPSHNTGHGTGAHWH